jgi:amino acid adenylation domain-containing protein
MSEHINDHRQLSIQDKRSLLAQLLKEKSERVNQEQLGQSSQRFPLLVPKPEQKHEPFPLTEIQQAYWLGRMGKFQEGNVSIHFYLEIESEHLDINRLTLAWQKIIERHDMLRAIILPNGKQQILKAVPAYKIEVDDLRGQNSAIVEATLKATRDRLSHQMLSAEQWPMFEFRASYLDREKIRLHLSFDALNIDTSSFMIMLSEWVQLYHNIDIILPHLELSYRDYVLGLEALRETPLQQKSLDYWRDRLETLPLAPDLPTTRLANSNKTKFCRYSGRLTSQIWQKLKTRAAHNGLTPASLLLAAYAEILNVWSQNPAFSINVTLFNRLPLHQQVNHILGDFTSLIPLEVDNSTQSTFVNKAKNIQRQLWNDIEYRYVSGVQILRELAQHRGRIGEAILPIVFTCALDSVGSTRGLNALSEFGHTVYSISQTPQVWLDHQVFEQDGALEFNWDVIEDIFPEGMLNDMFSSYCKLLKDLAVSNSAWETSSRNLLPNAQQKLFQEVNNTTASVKEILLHELFTAKVEKHQQDYAIITPNKSLTYQELNKRATQVGRKLKQLGAKPNTLVAVIMSKGWEQIVAALGVLMSGAAYLPLDSTLPLERIEFLLKQSEVKLGLTSPSLMEHQPTLEGLLWICVDSEEITVMDSSPLASIQTSTDLAYVIYTSGSTGMPKGVMIDHQGAVNTILDINERFKVSSQDRVLAVSALNFDLSVYDIFGLLAAGGTIVIPEGDSHRRDPSYWVELMSAYQVTVWNTVPALMQMLVEYLSERSAPDSLRLALLSGDWLPINLPTQMKSLWSGIETISLGGATEASIWSILYPIEQVDPSWKSIPYGKPMKNQSFHIFKKNLEPCPIWISGELYIGGKGLAKGYWQDEQKTVESFVFHPVTQERLYKTGDLGRYLPDGTIEFVGREDFQVKIGGYRIELGEIEVALNEHPAVRLSVVNAVSTPQGYQRLVAYVVVEQVLSPTATGNIQNQQKLPGDFIQEQLQGIINDPLTRFDFKLQEHGLRRDLVGSRIALQAPAKKNDLITNYSRRSSYRDFSSEVISQEEFSELLSCFYQIQKDNLPKYRYPSAGGLYPVQVYLYVKDNRIANLPQGIYYYHPKDHQLVLIASNVTVPIEVHGQANHLAFQSSAFSLFFVGDLDAISPMYGDLSRDFCLLEAGYMSQLIMDHIGDTNFGLCPIGGLNFEEIRSFFALGDKHQLLHSLVGGYIQSSPTTLIPEKKTAAPAISLPEALKQFLKNKLPDQMVPLAYVLLDTLPLTANGKIDRKALPAPENALKRSNPTAYIEPKTKLELALTKIIKEILSIDRVGIYHNFFDLGANSIQIVQIYNQVLQTVASNLTLVEMFEYPTINALANHLTQNKEQSAIKTSHARADARRAVQKQRKNRNN